MHVTIEQKRILSKWADLMLEMRLSSKDFTDLLASKFRRESASIFEDARIRAAEFKRKESRKQQQSATALHGDAKKEPAASPDPEEPPEDMPGPAAAPAKTEGK